MMRRILGGLLCLFAALPAQAQGSCKDPLHRQFDFWLGDWEVRKKDGTLAGTSRIEARHGGCVLHEQYSTPSGYTGESVNLYDAARKVWHQSWVDNGGLLLQLDGGLVDGSMRLEGPGQDAKGAPIRHRITWTPHPDGTVRQLWESTDASGTWTVAFDGTYKRK